MNGFIFLTLSDVIEIHRDQIERYGGQYGIRDIKLLQSAIGMPEASFDGEFLHPDVFEMAAAYAYHICKNHPFIDGNKRTALVCSLVFLEFNGISLDDPMGMLYDAMVSVALGGMKKHELAEVFRRLVKST
jgi:death-on-curing protein